jgi:hypothetical protein
LFLVVLHVDPAVAAFDLSFFGWFDVPSKGYAI